MAELNIVMLFLSVGLLGIFLGAQIAEAFMFVPIWKRMPADDFFEQHATVGPIIYRFFAPLTVFAAVIPLLSMVLMLVSGSEHYLLLALMGISTLAFFLSYPIFFKAANQQFADRSISNEALPLALVKWEQWHWLRMAFETVAFLCAMMLLWQA